MRRIAFSATVAALALAGAGCFDQPLFHRELPLATRVGNDPRFGALSPIPTKDDVALVDGRPFSISGFLALRGVMRTQSKEAILWAGTAAIAIQNATRARGREVEPPAAVEIARYALGEISAAQADNSLHQYFERLGVPPTPPEVRAELDRLLSQAVVRRNERVLASLNQP